MVKLDGGHHDPNHRWELRQYDLRIDADLLAQFNLEIERKVENYRIENNIESPDSTFGFVLYGNSVIDPLVEVPTEWIPVQPVLEVLDYRVEVQSVDALSSLQPDLDIAIRCCEQAIRMNTPFYWLIQ